jgi:hypothetical protein
MGGVDAEGEESSKDVDIGVSLDEGAKSELAEESRVQELIDGRICELIEMR